MIRFNIIGHGFLDFKEGYGMAFKSTSHQWRFADISLGRSVEFSVPATDRNRQLLGFGEDPSEYGDMMRRSLDCQLIYDGGARMGSMMVTAYESNAFRCVFYVDGSAWMQRLQDRKLSECECGFKAVTWSPNSIVVDASQADETQGVQLLRYENGYTGDPAAWQLAPSVNVRAYIEDIFSRLGIPFNTVLSYKYWMVAGAMKGAENESITFSQTSSNASSVTGSTLFDAAQFGIEWAASRVFGAYVGGGSQTVSGFKALRDAQLVLGTVPSGVFLIKRHYNLSQCECLGGYDANGGDDISGTTVQFSKDDLFFFADRDGNMVNYDVLIPDQYFGWQDTAHPVTISARASLNTDLNIGDDWFIQYNHPDATVFGFLKSVALATGLELIVDPVLGVSLVVPLYGTKTFKALRNVMSVESVRRNVGAWGDGTKEATIVFDSDDYVTERLTTRFEVANEGNADTAEHKALFSEGNIGNSGVLVQDVSMEGGSNKFVAKRWTLAYADNGSTYLQRVETPVPNGYDDIAANSTCVRVKVKAGEAEYFGLERGTTFLWRGMAYVWTDADWAGGIMSLTLQKVSQTRPLAITPTPALVSINASFNQGGAVVVGTDSLDTLKQYLTVTAYYDDSSSRVLADGEYMLSGTLAYPSATVTVDYQGETDTFTVAVAYDAQVAYLESTGTQYIDTGTLGKESTKIYVRFNYPNASSATGSGRLFGSRQTSSSNAFAVGTSSGTVVASNNKMFVCFDSQPYYVINVNFAINTWHTISFDASDIEFDGVSYGSQYTSTPFTTPQTLKLFGFDNGGVIGRGRVRASRFTIWDGNTLLHDFVPVRCGTTGYMYDRVSGTLFGNAGTGDFVVGADV